MKLIEQTRKLSPDEYDSFIRSNCNYESFLNFAILWDCKDELFNSTLIKIAIEVYDKAFSDGKLNIDDIVFTLMPFYHDDFVKYKPETKQHIIARSTMLTNLLDPNTIFEDNIFLTTRHYDIQSPICVNIKLIYKNEYCINDVLEEDNYRNLIEIKYNKIPDIITILEDVDNRENPVNVYGYLKEIAKYDNIYDYEANLANMGMLDLLPIDMFYNKGSLLKNALAHGIACADFMEIFTDYDTEYVESRLLVYEIGKFVKETRPMMYRTMCKLLK